MASQRRKKRADPSGQPKGVVKDMRKTPINKELGNIPVSPNRKWRLRRRQSKRGFRENEPS